MILLLNMLQRLHFKNTVLTSIRSVSSPPFSCIHSSATVRRDVSTLRETERRVEVRGHRWPHSLHIPHTWLRDHCRCQHCYDSDTMQRSYDVAKMPLNIRPCKVNLEEDTLHVTWPDSHQSHYPLQFLWQHYFGGRPSYIKDDKLPWTARTFPDISSITIPEKSVYNAVGLKKLIHNIEKHGLAMVSGVEATAPATTAVVEALAPIYRTFFGETWHVSGDMMHSDTAYSNDYLGAHTDTTYFTEGARLQVFHCTANASDGGNTLLVDGFQVAKKMKDKHPEAYKFFSNKTVAGEYIGDGQHLKNLQKVFTHHPVTGAMQQFRYNLYDRAPVSTLCVADVEEYYEHLHTLASIVTSKAMEHWCKLTPGNVLFVDNWRVMHGRSAFTGHRAMAGCYVSNDDYTSKARLLGIIH